MNKINSQLIEVLACPACLGALVWENHRHQNLFCRYCKLLYKINLVKNSNYEEYFVVNLVHQEAISTMPENISENSVGF